MKVMNVKKAVREEYGKIAKQGGGCGCATDAGSCCGDDSLAKSVSKDIGYSDEDMSGVPGGANLGLGCGNPVALATLKKDEVILDLGSGAGFDAFLAAKKIGKKGKVIGVDMTAEMIEKARENALKGNYKNVEFRLGEIENLPVADSTVDVVISNCVINLATDKLKVFKEVFRVLKAGGKLMVSDMVLTKELPREVRESMKAYVGCVAGAMMKADYIKTIEKAGFGKVEVVSEAKYPTKEKGFSDAVVSVNVRAIKK